MGDPQLDPEPRELRDIVVNKRPTHVWVRLARCRGATPNPPLLFTLIFRSVISGGLQSDASLPDSLPADPLPDAEDDPNASSEP